MATKPGPALALAALAALFMMKGKGKGGSGSGDGTGNGSGDGTGNGSADDAGKLADGTVVADPAPAQPPGAPSGGGTKVPGGTGTGGGKFKVPAVLPNKVWISPDCQTVVEGKDYFTNIVLPRFIEAQKSLGASLEGVAPEEIDPTKYEQTVGGGGFVVDVYSYLAAVFGLIDNWEDYSGMRVWSTADNMYTAPRSCMMQFPGFHIGDRYNSLRTNADSDKLEEDLGEYANKFPELTSWLMSLEERLFAIEGDAQVILGRTVWLFSA